MLGLPPRLNLFFLLRYSEMNLLLGPMNFLSMLKRFT